MTTQEMYITAQEIQKIMCQFDQYLKLISQSPYIVDPIQGQLVTVNTGISRTVILSIYKSQTKEQKTAILRTLGITSQGFAQKYNHINEYVTTSEWAQLSTYFQTFTNLYSSLYSAHSYLLETLKQQVQDFYLSSVNNVCKIIV